MSDYPIGKFAVRAHFSEPVHHSSAKNTPEEDRANVRTINGEPLPAAVPASLCEGAHPDAKGRPGASEDVDPIDAAIAVTSDYGLNRVWQLSPDPVGHGVPDGKQNATVSLMPSVYTGYTALAPDKRKPMQDFLNKGKPDGQVCEVIEVHDCMGTSGVPTYNGNVMVCRTETPDEARLLWQKKSNPRSFHSAIFGGAANHRQVTAYDIAIGGGKAATDPLFYQYLCAVADWRLKQGKTEKARASILQWNKFLIQFAVYWKDEPQWRKELIEGNANYYSTGNLPACVPTLQAGLPPSVVCETLDDIARRQRPPQPPTAPATAKSSKGGA